MINRGGRQSDIAAYFGVNGGRISAAETLLHPDRAGRNVP
jgi:hypothetical protein